MVLVDRCRAISCPGTDRQRVSGPVATLRDGGNNPISRVWTTQWPIQWILGSWMTFVRPLRSQGAEACRPRMTRLPRAPLFSFSCTLQFLSRSPIPSQSILPSTSFVPRPYYSFPCRPSISPHPHHRDVAALAAVTARLCIPRLPHTPYSSSIYPPLSSLSSISFPGLFSTAFHAFSLSSLPLTSFTLPPLLPYRSPITLRTSSPLSPPLSIPSQRYIFFWSLPPFFVIFLPPFLFNGPSTSPLPRSYPLPYPSPPRRSALIPHSTKIPFHTFSALFLVFPPFHPSFPSLRSPSLSPTTPSPPPPHQSLSLRRHPAP